MDKNEIAENIARLETEEILERIEKGYFSDEGLEIAIKILADKGIKTQPTKKAPEKFQESEEQLIFNRHRGNMIAIWFISAFLSGFSSKQSYSSLQEKSIEDSIWQGLITSIIIGIIVVIIYTFNKKKLDFDAIKSTYKKNLQSLIGAVFLILLVLMIKLIFLNANSFVVIDIALLSIFLVGLFKKPSSSVKGLAVYAFIAIIVGAFSEHSNYGAFWAFLFFLACQNLSIKSTVNKLDPIER